MARSTRPEKVARARPPTTVDRDEARCLPAGSYSTDKEERPEDERTQYRKRSFPEPRKAGRQRRGDFARISPQSGERWLQHASSRRRPRTMPAMRELLRGNRGACLVRASRRQKSGHLDRWPGLCGRRIGGDPRLPDRHRGARVHRLRHSRGRRTATEGLGRLRRARLRGGNSRGARTRGFTGATDRETETPEAVGPAVRRARPDGRDASADSARGGEATRSSPQEGRGREGREQEKSPNARRSASGFLEGDLETMNRRRTTRSRSAGAARETGTKRDQPSRSPNPDIRPAGESGGDRETALCSRCHLPLDAGTEAHGLTSGRIDEVLGGFVPAMEEEWLLFCEQCMAEVDRRIWDR